MLKRLIKFLLGKSEIKKWHDIRYMDDIYEIRVSDAKRILMNEKEIAEFNYHLQKLWSLIK